jgi:hypothetical protein
MSQLGETIKIEGRRLPRYSQPITTATAGYMEKPGSVLWYNPVSQKIHLGDVIQNEPPLNPDWNNFKNMPWVNDTTEAQATVKERRNKGELVAGVAPTDLDELILRGMNQEYYPKAHEFLELYHQHGEGRAGLKAARELLAGVFSRADFPDLVAVVQSIRMMITGKPAHVIRDLFTNMATDKLTLKVGKFTDFDAIQEDLGEFDVPYEGGKGSYDFYTMTLKKNAWHMAFSEEFGMTDYTEPVEAQHMNALNGQMDLVENKRVYDQVLASDSSGQSQGDWTAFSNNLSVRNPRPDLDALIGAIDDLHKSQATTVLSSRKVANAWRQNTYVNSSPSVVSNPPAGVPYVGRANVSGIQMPLLEGLNWAIDSLVPNTWYAVFSPDCMIVATGPTRTASYFDTKSGIRGTMFKKWFGAKVMYTDLIKRGTGVAS